MLYYFFIQKPRNRSGSHRRHHERTTSHGERVNQKPETSTSPERPSSGPFGDLCHDDDNQTENDNSVSHAAKLEKKHHGRPRSEKMPTSSTENLPPWRPAGLAKGKSHPLQYVFDTKPQAYRRRNYPFVGLDPIPPIKPKANKNETPNRLYSDKNAHTNKQRHQGCLQTHDNWKSDFDIKPVRIGPERETHPHVVRLNRTLDGSTHKVGKVHPRIAKNKLMDSDPDGLLSSCHKVLKAASETLDFKQAKETDDTQERRQHETDISNNKDADSSSEQKEEQSSTSTHSCPCWKGYVKPGVPRKGRWVTFKDYVECQSNHGTCHGDHTSSDGQDKAQSHGHRDEDETNEGAFDQPSNNSNHTHDSSKANEDSHCLETYRKPGKDNAKSNVHENEQLNHETTQCIERDEAKPVKGDETGTKEVENNDGHCKTETLENSELDERIPGEETHSVSDEDHVPDSSVNFDKDDINDSSINLVNFGESFGSNVKDIDRDTEVTISGHQEPDILTEQEDDCTTTCQKSTSGESNDTTRLADAHNDNVDQGNVSPVVNGKVDASKVYEAPAKKVHTGDDGSLDDASRCSRTKSSTTPNDVNVCQEVITDSPQNLGEFEEAAYEIGEEEAAFGDSTDHLCVNHYADEDFKQLDIETFTPDDEIHRVEDDFYNTRTCDHETDQQDPEIFSENSYVDDKTPLLGANETCVVANESVDHQNKESPTTPKPDDVDKMMDKTDNDRYHSPPVPFVSKFCMGEAEIRVKGNRSTISAKDDFVDIGYGANRTSGNKKDETENSICADNVGNKNTNEVEAKLNHDHAQAVSHEGSESNAELVEEDSVTSVGSPISPTDVHKSTSNEQEFPSDEQELLSDEQEVLSSEQESPSNEQELLSHERQRTLSEVKVSPANKQITTLSEQESPAGEQKSQSYERHGPPSEAQESPLDKQETTSLEKKLPFNSNEQESASNEQDSPSEEQNSPKAESRSPIHVHGQQLPSEEQESPSDEQRSPVDEQESTDTQQLIPAETTHLDKFENTGQHSDAEHSYKECSHEFVKRPESVARTDVSITSDKDKTQMPPCWSTFDFTATERPNTAPEKSHDISQLLQPDKILLYDECAKKPSLRRSVPKNVNAFPEATSDEDISPLPAWSDSRPTASFPPVTGDTQFDKAFEGINIINLYANLVARYSYNSQNKIRAALERMPPDDNLHRLATTCSPAKKCAREVHAFRRALQDVLMRFYKVEEAQEGFCRFVEKMSRSALKSGKNVVDGDVSETNILHAIEEVSSAAKASEKPCDTSERRTDYTVGDDTEATMYAVKGEESSIEKDVEKRGEFVSGVGRSSDQPNDSADESKAKDLKKTMEEVVDKVSDNS